MLWASVLVACTIGGAVGDDLSLSMYKKALRSEDMTELVQGGLDGFIGRDRPAGVVAIMFHESSCGVCHTALPELDAAAKKFKEGGVDVSIGHIEVSASKELLKRRFQLRGFPGLVVFRKRLNDVADADLPDALVGQSLTVAKDTELIARAARSAKMGEERNALRMKAAGKTGEVLEVDLADGTAKLAVADVGKLWFPLEVLLRADGAMLPYLRSEASFMYLGTWTTRDMHRFLERMVNPLVSEVREKSMEATRALVVKDVFPALFFCGGEHVTSGFIEAATAAQGKMRSFHVKDLAACPAAVEASSVLVYSPPGQQWAPSTKALRAAVAMTDVESLKDDDAMIQWIKGNSMPGLLESGYHNFADFVNSGRHGILVAVRGPRGTGGEIAKMVEKRLRTVAKPESLDPRADLYSYSNESYFISVVDGSLDGLASFGISTQKLPRVVVFLGRDAWYEDENDLTVETLTMDLQNLPNLWKSTDSLYGYILWFLKQTSLSFKYYHKTCIDFFGPDVGKFVMPLLFTTFTAYYGWQLLSGIRLLVSSLTQSDADVAKQAEGGKTSEVEEEVKKVK